MIDWVWTRNEVQPQDVLDAARNIAVNSTQITIDPISHWVEPQRYIEWARAALSRHGDDAWDSGVGWAKRAVCCRMDAILVHNHLAAFLGRNYGQKADYLRQLNVPGLSLLRDIVIEPRNDMEHSYTMATEEAARRACELAELFLAATDSAGKGPAIAALGWRVNYSGTGRTKDGIEQWQHDFTLTRDQDPMLLIDGYSEPPQVFVLYPKEQSLSFCSCDKFGSAEIIELNARLRQCVNSTNFTVRHFDANLMKTLRDQLRL